MYKFLQTNITTQHNNIITQQVVFPTSLNMSITVLRPWGLVGKWLSFTLNISIHVMSNSWNRDPRTWTKGISFWLTRSYWEQNYSLWLIPRVVPYYLSNLKRKVVKLCLDHRKSVIQIHSKTLIGQGGKSLLSDKGLTWIKILHVNNVIFFLSGG